MKERIYKDLILVLKMCFIIFAFLGVWCQWKYWHRIRNRGRWRTVHLSR